MISAKIIADSKNKFGDRITSFELVFPRIVLAEFNTHRMFSRNSASSRAIPFKKMLEMVERNPFIPIKWMQDHKGMQGTEYFSDVQSEILTKRWLQARDNAIFSAKVLSDDGVTKQMINRLIEPFMWHKVIVTATEYENFFALRNHEAAEIHIQELAKLMLLAYNDSTPKLLNDGEWHIPYGDKINEDKIYGLLGDYKENQIKIATARCAGVSYTIVGDDGVVEDYDKLIKRFEKLKSMNHLSPFEHCAKVMTESEYKSNIRGFGYTHVVGNSNKTSVYYDDFGWCGNFKGFIQLRKTFENENQKDSRVIKK